MCAKVSVKCNVSSATSRQAVQTVCKGLYGHEFYLTKEEAINNDSELSEYTSSIESIPRKKMRLQEDAKKELIPVTKDEYKPYENVLPSLKTIVEYKQLLSAQHEKDTALTLYNIPEDVKVTFTIQHNDQRLMEIGHILF